MADGQAAQQADLVAADTEQLAEIRQQAGAGSRLARIQSLPLGGSLGTAEAGAVSCSLAGISLAGAGAT